MGAANLFCLATRSEGWCNALMEALACGLPVVTTRVGGNAEVVRDGRDGLLVPFWDARAFTKRALAHVGYANAVVDANPSRARYESPDPRFHSDAPVDVWQTRAVVPDGAGAAPSRC